MNAKEARELFLKNDKTSVIRRKIDGYIKNAASNGDSETKFILNETHDYNAVVQTLIKDDFKVKCVYNPGDRWASDSYIYKIAW